MTFLENFVFTEVAEKAPGAVGHGQFLYLLKTHRDINFT